MYLTRFELNPARRGTRKLLGSPHAMHAAVLASFPPDRGAQPGDGAENGRVLWRIDQADHRTVLYISSPERPDCTHLVEQTGWPTQPEWDTRDYRRLLDRLGKGQMWAFRLAANPTKSTRLAAGRRSQRVGHVTVEQQRAWLLERAAGWGFTVPEAGGGGPAVLVTGRRVRTFRRGDSQVELSTVVFDGRLVVEDPSAFRRAMIRGLGPAKGYGCGLLTLADPNGTT